MSPAKPQADHPGRLLALLVFLVGVGMLVFVFVTALHLFQSPVPGLEPLQKPGAPPPPAANIGTALADFALRLLLLMVMTLAGSILASKGAHLYFGTVYPSSEPTIAPSVANNGRGSKSVSEVAPSDKLPS